jgi:hypothetical protein
MTLNSHRARRHQSGSTLIMAMIFLLLFAMIMATTYRSSLTSVRAIGNMQWRSESINATNDAIAQLLSNVKTFTDPATITASVVASPLTFDANGDAVPDITVTFPVVTLDGVSRAGPRCIKVEPIPSTELDPNNSQDLGCFGNNAAGNTGLGVTNASGTVTSIAQTPALCANTEWSVTVQAVDAVTNTSVRVVQGVGVRVPTASVALCN